ncbi:MAG: flagellar export chaperone FliS [Candidatus Puniceispirillales bacterium]|jgi:flagellar protein FliS|nr:flagellar protein FliS [Pseudomonadota bacterium]|tara:strand:- start:6 stop:395 length:390 start_codon:yes stop_codon:yes gene_type:complete
MNYSPSMRKYVESDIQAKVSNTSPHKIIEQVLIELKNHMETLAYSIDNEPTVSSIKSNAFSKSLTAIYILQSSLDFEKGGEIATNLFNLYAFCKNGIMKGFMKKNSKLIYDAIPPIEEILDGWKQIRNQ